MEGPPGWVNNLFINSAISSSSIHPCLPQPKAAFCPLTLFSQTRPTAARVKNFAPHI